MIRPTADRVRQATFDVLGQRLDGVLVLDLFAGTGAFGLEAVSRGAAKAVLVDSGKEALALCRGNALALGFSERVEIVALPWFKALETLAAQGRRFDLVFSDPPYALEAAEAVLRALAPAASGAAASNEALLTPDVGADVHLTHRSGAAAGNEALLTLCLLAPGATVVLEHSQHEAVPERVGPLLRIDSRAFGLSAVSIFRLTAKVG